MKTMIRNPFITSGYVSADYFCDRRFESEQLVREVMNGNNLALVSTRRMGKTGLIRHCFQFPEIKQGYYTFFIDIYDSRSLRDLVFALSKEILEVLKPVGKKALQSFWECVKSLQASISFDVNGMPSLNLGLGDIQAPATTLDEIFRYLEQADKPCLVAIDEFQQISGYVEKNVEANRLQKNLAIGKNLPTIAIGAGYMYDDLMDKSHPFGIAFATVSIPISNWWGGSHAIKKQKLQLKYAEYERDDTGELLMIKMQKAWNDVDDAYKQILIARKSIEQATENLKLNEDYYKAGTTSMSDLLDAQSMFQQSRDTYVDAYSQYQIKKLEYLLATGR